MSSNTVAEFAAELNKPVSLLLEQFAAAGVAKRAGSDPVTEADKQRLLSYLKSVHGTLGQERRKITLTKRSTTEIKQADASGRARTIQVEVRKKRTFVKREDEADRVTEPAAQAEEAARAADLARLEEEARLQAERLRQEEEELARKRREREQAEARAAEQA
ncbi:MAG: translation initiation factor IF-2 associated domain-containing protein, partial [Tepidimonas sp.]|uniref:translation initiation factor IF-2 associated domain-containing protein n=1 Tax=Tepidimonas sp. TaxID=2002775 RepID=UPI004054EF5C